MDSVAKFFNGLSEIFSGNKTESQSYTPFNNHEIKYLFAQSFLLFLTFVNISWTIVIFVVLRKHRHFHVHLISMIVNMFIQGTLYFICRIFLIIETFTCYQTCYDTSPYMFSRNLFYIDFARILLGAAYLCTLPAIIYERVYATIQLRKYEKRINYVFIVWAIFNQYFIGLFFAIVVYKELFYRLLKTIWNIFQNKRFIEVVNIIGLVIGSEIVCLAFSYAFFVYDRINQGLYKILKTSGSTCELSERYQLAENIKTAKLMKNSIIAYAIFNANLMIMFFLTSWLEDPNSKKWVQFVYEIEISIYAIVLSTIGIMSVETWKIVFIKTFKKLFKSTEVNPSRQNENLAVGGIPMENLGHVTGEMGENIVFKIDQEGEIYFNQLHKSWG